nr:uncharacterized protein LOC127301337 [Lolium perenne]
MPPYPGDPPTPAAPTTITLPPGSGQCALHRHPARSRRSWVQRRRRPRLVAVPICSIGCSELLLVGSSECSSFHSAVPICSAIPSCSPPSDLDAVASALASNGSCSSGLLHVLEQLHQQRDQQGVRPHPVQLGLPQPAPLQGLQFWQWRRLRRRFRRGVKLWNSDCMHFVQNFSSLIPIPVLFGVRSMLSWPCTLGMKGGTKVKVYDLMAL